MLIPAQSASIDIPSQTVDLGYEVVSHTITLDSNGYCNQTFSAPTGKKIFSGSLFGVPNYSVSGAVGSYPSSDGTSWTVQGAYEWLTFGSPTLYLICINI
jgi:hypothetical protein